MISVDEAQRRLADLPIIAHAQETIPVAEASGRTAAIDCHARVCSPLFDNSAMDGFAVRSVDLVTPSTTLRIIGEAAAGRPFVGDILAGGATVISTGALLPKGADTVIPVEDAETENLSLRLSRNWHLGQHVRRAGENFRPGDTLIRAGEVLTGTHIGLLLMGGCDALTVTTLPSVAVVVTGREIVSQSSSPLLARSTTANVIDANGPMLQTWCELFSGRKTEKLYAGDSLDETRNAIAKALEKHSVVCTTGGLSVGAHDHVRAALRELGYTEVISGVAQKPGKPFTVAKNGKQIVFALPGNPCAALACFLFYVAPYLERCASRSLHCHKMRANLVCDFSNFGERTQLVFGEAIIDSVATALNFKPFPPSSSYCVSELNSANSIAAISPRSTLASRQPLQIQLFSYLSFAD